VPTVVAGYDTGDPPAGTVPPVKPRSDIDASLDVVLLQRRTLRTLMAGLIPAGAAMSGAYAASAVLGEDLSLRLTGSVFPKGPPTASPSLVEN